MMEGENEYQLDLRGQMILECFEEQQETFRIMERIVRENLRKMLDDNNVIVTAIETRIKTSQSLAGKLKLKGYKYSTVFDLTDLIGARIITFYSDDIDKISALVGKTFEVDWQQSVDKRKSHELDSFGYMSLHYICQIPPSMYKDNAHPLVNKLKFEIQMRTALQHVWANMYHDTGYKSGIEVPAEYLRNLNRLAGILELADDEFSRIRLNINNYRRQVTNLVHSGKFEDIPLNGDTFRSYLELKPFDKLLQKIAAINQAEIYQASEWPFYFAFIAMGFKNLGDIDNLVKKYSDDAYKLALAEIGETDLDIISASVAVQNLCAVYILENGGEAIGIKMLLDKVIGENTYNEARAQRIYNRALGLDFMKK